MKIKRVDFGRGNFDLAISRQKKYIYISIGIAHIPLNNHSSLIIENVCDITFWKLITITIKPVFKFNDNDNPKRSDKSIARLYVL